MPRRPLYTNIQHPMFVLVIVLVLVLETICFATQATLTLKYMLRVSMTGACAEAGGGYGGRIRPSHFLPLSPTLPF